MNWNDALATADAAVAATFDTDTVTIVPKSTGRAVNGPAVDDGSRAPFTRMASVERGPVEPGLAERPAGDPGSPHGGAVQYEAVMTATVAGWPYLPQRGDQVTCGNDRYSVASVQDDRSGRPAFYLNRAG